VVLVLLRDDPGLHELAKSGDRKVEWAIISGIVVLFAGLRLTQDSDLEARFSWGHGVPGRLGIDVSMMRARPVNALWAVWPVGWRARGVRSKSFG